MIFILIFLWYFQIPDAKQGAEGILVWVLGVMGSAITALSIYIVSMHKESRKMSQENTAGQIKIYDETVKKFEQLSKDTNKILYDKTLEDRLLKDSIKELTTVIRDRLK